MRFKNYFFILGFLVNSGIFQNLSGKYANFSNDELKMVNSQYYSELYTPSENYDKFKTDLTSLYVNNKNLVENYYFYMFATGNGNILINPCKYGYKWCKSVSNLESLEDTPVIERGKNILILFFFQKIFSEKKIFISN